MARGLAKDIDKQGQRDNERLEQGEVPDVKGTRTDSNKIPLRSIISELQDPQVPLRTDQLPSPCSRKKVQLPDITGLTSIVASPAKPGLEYVPYHAKDTVELDGEYFQI